MARPLRIEFPGAFYYVTLRGNEKKAVFKSLRDREKSLSYLKSATEPYGAVVHVYCLMDNHYHLLLETPLGNLSREIGEGCGVSESGVSQESRRLWIRQKNDKKLAKLITKMVKGLALSNV